MRRRPADLARRSRRQLLAGLVAVPLSVLPFVAYGTLTPEGRLLRDRVLVAVDAPELPRLDKPTMAHLQEVAPEYEGAVMPLVYHGIGEATDGGYAVSPERFAEHIAALDAAGMNFVTATEVAEAFDGGDPLPPDAVLVTFDDGRTDALLWATPLLEEAGAEATMFVITGAASERSVYYADWGELGGFADGGVWDLQAHTDALHTEIDTDAGPLPALTGLAPGETLDEYRERIRADLDRADAILEARTGQRPVAFAYPFGAWGVDRTNDDRIRGILAREIAARYRLAFHQDGQDEIELATPRSLRTGLRRLDVGDWSGVELVERIAAARERTRLPADPVR
jgi:peptidoglycan/xylan/chitin deacetylase (PgdA/CDA1 family)